MRVNSAIILRFEQFLSLKKSLHYYHGYFERFKLDFYKVEFCSAYVHVAYFKNKETYEL